MSFHVPGEESLNPAEIKSLQEAKLKQLLSQTLKTNAFYKKNYQSLDLDADATLLHELPFTTRSELQEDQATTPPYGTNLGLPPNQYFRLHQTSGSSGVPLYWLDTNQSWQWWKKCWGMIYRAAGVIDTDRIAFPFSFGPFVGFWGAFEASTELGNFSLPCGGMTTSARLKHMLDHRTTIICCTPTYALRMAEVAADEGINLPTSSVRALIVAGEPGGNILAVRSAIESKWGARVFDHVGMTEIGPWGFECEEAPGGVHVAENEFIAEVIDPGTGKPLADGQPGELVLTNLGRLGSPLIRYRTGDQVTLIRRQCPCGRSFAWAEGGVLGRYDDMLWIRGNNVFPTAIESIIRGFDEIGEFRITVDETASLAELRIEIELTKGKQVEGLAVQLEDAMRDQLHFRPNVDVVPPGVLPRFDLKAKRVVRIKRD